MSESSKPALKLRGMSRTLRKTLTPAMLCSTRTRPLKCGGWPVFPAPSVRPLGQVFALDTLGNRVDRTLKSTQNRSNTQEGDYPKIGVHYTLGLPSWSGSATPTGPTARRLSDCWSPVLLALLHPAHLGRHRRLRRTCPVAVKPLPVRHRDRGHATGVGVPELNP